MSLCPGRRRICSLCLSKRLRMALRSSQSPLWRFQTGKSRPLELGYLREHKEIRRGAKNFSEALVCSTMVQQCWQGKGDHR